MPHDDTVSTTERTTDYADHIDSLDNQSIQSIVHERGRGTEMGWLVSYADMMTLLFGLFVILFSLASDQSRNMEDILKEASKKFFAKTGDASSPKVDPNDDQIHTMEKEINRLQALVKKQKQIIDERERASRPAQTEVPDNTMARQVSSLEITNDELKKKMSALEEENQHLRTNIAENNLKAQSYIMVLLTWETEKHDLDLEVVTPSNRLFNFKSRHYKSEPGRFEIDSRYGPGIELWRAGNFKAGQYRTRISFYNHNGNLRPAKAHLNVITNLATYSGENIMMANRGETKEILFDVDEKGAVRFGK